MNTQPAPYRRLRLILDGVLIGLLILVASLNYLSAQARTETHPPARGVSATGFSGPAIPDPSGTHPQAGPALADNNTIAAMIAAENAALTLPVHVVNLPLITH